MVEIVIASQALVANLCGDPTERSVAVYLPPGYDEATESYPLLVDLVGFTGSGFSHLGWRPFGESVPQRLDRLVAEGRMGPVVAAFPDCFTSLGGNQYVNSPATGRWEDFLIDEMLPRLENDFHLAPGREHRAVFGKSSGGFGALFHGLTRADAWGAVACHSGDMGWELVYATEFPRVLDVVAKHDGFAGFLDHVRDAPKIEDDEMHALMMLAMGASYAPDPSAPKGVSLPVDLRTCQRDRAAWSRWLAFDPLEIIDTPEAEANLRSLLGLYIDCGSRDQYHLVYGARTFVAWLERCGIPHHYEEFDDDHSSIDYRMDVSLPFLYRALTAG